MLKPAFRLPVRGAWNRALMVAATYAGAILTGAVLTALGVPLAWMIGSILSTAGLSFVLPAIEVPAITRPIGQAVIAATVGLTITPATIDLVGTQILPIALAAVLTLASGFLAGAVLSRIARIDLIAGCLACVPGGPVEMATIAQRVGVPPGPVVFAQTMRIVMLVLIIPPLLLALSPVQAAAILPAGEVPPTLLRVGFLLAVAAAGGFAFIFLRLPNPFFLGAMTAAGIASFLAWPVDHPPYWSLVAAQVMLGVWLGKMIDRKLILESPRYTIAVFCSTIVLMSLCAVIAWSLSGVVHTSWQTMILATAPGGLTEMALTAGLLRQGVVIVTAYHVVRIFIILSAASPIFRLVARRLNQGQPQDAP